MFKMTEFGGAVFWVLVLMIVILLTGGTVGRKKSSRKLQPFNMSRRSPFLCEWTSVLTC